MMLLFKRTIIVLIVTLTNLNLLLAQNNNDEIHNGVELFKSGEMEHAKTFFQEYTKSNSEDPEGYYYLGRIFFRQRDYNKAEKSLKKAIKLQPNSSLYHTWMGNTYGNKINDVNFLKKMSMAKKIKNHFTTALELDENNLEAREGLVHFYKEAPGIAGGSVEKAMEHAKILKSQDKYQGYSLMAQIYEKQKNYDLTEQEFVSAVEEFPDSLGANYRLGYFYQRMAKWDKAFEIFEQVIADSAENWGAWYQLGRTGALSGLNLDRSELALRKYLTWEPDENNPSHAATHWRLGMIYEHKGRKNLARQEYQTALKLDRTFKQALESLKKLK